MTDPDQEEQPCFITEEIEAQMIAEGYVFEVPTRIHKGPMSGDESDAEPETASR